MSGQLFAAFVLFSIVTLFTPGPNNIMLMASGLNFGFRRTLPHVIGVDLGFGFMVLCVGLGLGALFAAFPPLYTVLKFAGAAYLLYLAWKIAMAGVVEGEGGGRPFSFLQAAAFQWVNVKGWVMAVGSVTTYAALAPFPFNAAVIAGVFIVFGAASSITWVLFGTVLKRVVSDPETVRVFNIAMALLLLLSIVIVFVEG